MGKDIIINGIDVSECRFYEPKAQKMTCHEEAITKPCENTPICYYKLLQKSYIEIQRLQKENEELKNRLKTLDEEEFVYEVTEIEYNNFKKMNKYKQALEEINILAKNYCNACDEFKAKTYKNKNDCLYCNYGFIKRKINEALNDRD